jgi:hypothetical protein
VEWLVGGWVASLNDITGRRIWVDIGGLGSWLFAVSLAIGWAAVGPGYISAA